MPIWLRKFTFHQMHTYYEEQNKSQSSGGDLGSQTKQIKDGKIQLPSHYKGKLNQKTPKY